MNYEIEKYGDIAVYWNAEIDGDGRQFVGQYLSIVRSITGRVGRAFEFCAGTGYIGFSLLANNLCETLCLAEIDPKAVAALKKTVTDNGLDDRVTVYLCDALEGIPESERWDLVVGFPPHHPAPFEDDEGICGDEGIDLHCIDLDLKLHQAFYQNVRKFLSPHGSIIMIENYEGADESVLEPFLQSGGLEIVRSFMYSDHRFPLNSFYYLWSRPRAAELVYQAAPAHTIKLRLSQMEGQVITKGLDGFQKLRAEIFNDLNRPAEIVLRQEQGPQRTMKLLPGETKSSAVYLCPPGLLSFFESDGGKGSAMKSR